MFRTYPVIIIRIAALAFILYYLLNISSEAIKVSKALQQSQFLLRDLVRYFLLLVASIGFWKLYRQSLGRIGIWVVVAAMFTAIFGIVAYLCLSLNLLMVPQNTWQTSLLAFFEFLKGNFLMQFQSFLGGEQSMAAWVSNWITEFKFQFLPKTSDFPIGRGWIKLYLLFKLLASLLLKFTVIFSCAMFLFPRPLVKHNLLIALLIMLWLFSPIFGGSMTVLGSWILNTKAINGESVKNLVGLAIVVLIAFRMWVDATDLQSLVKTKTVRKKKAVKKPLKKATAKVTQKPTKKTAPKATKSAKAETKKVAKTTQKKSVKLPKTTILKK